MSTEQDKDNFSLKRNRGGDEFDDLVEADALLYSPDKTKRKSNPQALAPLSEYAPPQIPSAHHLVAANPFDDHYNTTSFKPLLSNIQPHYPDLRIYSHPRTGPLMSSRRPSFHGGPNQMQNHFRSFGHNQMGMALNRLPGFNYEHHKNPTNGNQSPFNNINNNNIALPPKQHFPPDFGDKLNQASQHNIVRTFGPKVHRIGNAPPNKKNSPDSTPQLNKNVTQSSTTIPKKEVCELVSGKRTSQNASPCKQSHGSEENMCQENSVDQKSKRRCSLFCLGRSQPNTRAKVNGIIHPDNDAKTKSPKSGVHIDTASQERRNGGGGVASSNPNKHNQSSAEPVFPCGLCLKDVTDDQEAILCEASCQKWFHRVCTGMTETAYNLLTAEVWAVWGCDVCMEEKGAQLLGAKELKVTSQ